MFTKKKIPVTDRTVYMEIYGQNKTAYRVIKGSIGKNTAYGIEVQNYTTGRTETIPDFSGNLEDAMCFAEMLIRNKIPPEYVYIKALDYLSHTI